MCVTVIGEQGIAAAFNATHRGDEEGASDIIGVVGRRTRNTTAPLYGATAPVAKGTSCRPVVHPSPCLVVSATCPRSGRRGMACVVECNACVLSRVVSAHGLPVLGGYLHHEPLLYCLRWW